jgi:signal transduction histidine kinase
MTLFAQCVMEAHGGAITASNREGGGLRVSISVPISN